MKETIITIIALLIDGLISGAGMYYLIKEKNNKDQEKYTALQL